MRKIISINFLSLLLTSAAFVIPSIQPTQAQAARGTLIEVRCSSESSKCTSNNFKVWIGFSQKLSRTVSGKQVKLCWMGQCKIDRTMTNKFGYAFAAAQFAQSGIRKGVPTWVDAYLGSKHIVHQKTRVLIGCSPAC